MWEQHFEFMNIKITMYQLMLLVAIVSLILGYFLAFLPKRAGRGDYPKQSVEKERIISNAAFMKGLNYILSDKRDEAIEEFSRAVAQDTQTVESYMALGNLFRSKGEFERAIRIRQSLILRPHLDAKIKLQALYDLGLDYRMAGLFDRAIKSFNDVLAEDSGHAEAYRQLVQIYEETRDWKQAFQTWQKLAKLTGNEPKNVMAHYHVEMGKVHFEKGELSPARGAYKKALSLDSSCVDAYLHLGDLLLKDKKPKKAINVWRKIIEVAPEMTFLVFGRLARVYSELADLKPVEDFLNECAAKEKDPLARLALGRMFLESGNQPRALDEFRKALELDSGLLEIHRELGLLLLSLENADETLEAYRDLLDHLTPLGADFQCAKCGFESQKLMWRCLQCQEWDTMALHRRKPVLLSLKKSDSEVVPNSEKNQGDRS
ncbi:MAG: tetratricopeptide repeat protein [Deltaproteobacteria bacterium]|nr:tetratricopeptide repeat protein [Deltaproteobacteria bacterium]MBW2051352.1 tetratricopeptide repeat protein [Deltaproteobacteria bacterium]MBW2139701.1 tetratricopeptide repeat protein [Deltaproteobacteria bacterium]MBW2321960.1 tetratricopeptide repeat protein [Deltaproteobacteria bacterium]